MSTPFYVASQNLYGKEQEQIMNKICKHCGESVLACRERESRNAAIFAAQKAEIAGMSALRAARQLAIEAAMANGKEFVPFVGVIHGPFMDGGFYQSGMVGIHAAAMTDKGVIAV